MSANTTPVKVKKTDLSGTSTAYKVFAVVILIMLAIFFLFPLYWIVTGSFKSAIDINAKVPVWFPMNPTMGNYDKLFAKPAFLWLFNIVFISAMAMILTCITAALAGYAPVSYTHLQRGICPGPYGFSSSGVASGLFKAVRLRLPPYPAHRYASALDFPCHL